MYHTVVTFGVHWVAPVMMGGFFVVLPVLLDNCKPGKH